MLTCDISSLDNALKLPATTHRKGDESSGKRKGARGAPSLRDARRQKEYTGANKSAVWI